MIYFDNRASTRIDRDALKVMEDVYLNNFSNPSSIHQLGFESEKVLRDIRGKFAKDLGVSPREIYFSPSASFSNNLIIKGAYRGGMCLLNPLEHSSSYDTCMETYEDGVVFFPLGEGGSIDEGKILERLNKDIKFVSLMHVNNETGEIYNIKKITRLIKEYNGDIIVHCDGVQAFGKGKINLKDLGVDTYVASSHKINGPRGASLIYIREGLNIEPIIYGGNQEGGLVSGTENLGAIKAFHKAYEKLRAFDDKVIYELNQYIKDNIRDIPNHIINGKNTSPYILSLSFENIKAEPLIHLLETREVYVSSGSACNRGEKSRVLSRMNLSDKYIDGTIRVSFDKNSTLKEGEEFVRILKEDIKMIRGIMS